MSNWGDEKIIIVLLLVGFLPALALPRRAAWVCMSVAALGAVVLLFVIDPHDSPANYWIAAMFTGLVLGVAVRQVSNFLIGQRVEQAGHG